MALGFGSPTDSENPQISWLIQTTLFPGWVSQTGKPEGKADCGTSHGGEAEGKGGGLRLAVQTEEQERKGGGEKDAGTCGELFAVELPHGLT